MDDNEIADAAIAGIVDDRARRRLVAARADSIGMREPTWLDYGRIPTGAITLLAGREGIGKSTIAHALVAQVTTGKMEGTHFGTPKGVIIVAAEDDWSCVIVPRLVAAGADLTRVLRVEARTEDGTYDTVSLPADLDALQELCHRHDVKLVVCDPLMSLIHGGLDTHKDRDVRRALDPLSRFAGNSSVAVLALIHVNKSTADDPLNAIMGSRAFSAVARSVLFCMADDEEAEDGSRVESFLYGHAKCNLGPKLPTLRYHLTPARVAVTHDKPLGIATSRVVWDGEDGRSLREAWEKPPPRERDPVLGELGSDIVDWMGEQGRTVSAAELGEAFPDVKRSTLDSSLTRLVQRGILTRPLRGHYVLATVLAPSPIPKEVQERGEVQELPALPALLALPEGREKLQEVPLSRGSDDLTPSDDCTVCGLPLDPGETTVHAACADWI